MRGDRLFRGLGLAAVPSLNRKRLTSHTVRQADDVRAFFDDVARDYRESHGHAATLLRDRLHLLRALLPKKCGGLLVEIGCGPGQHLLALAEHFERAIGLDLSPAMIELAESLRRQHPLRDRIAFAVDPAERLATLRPTSVDALFCVGAFEHMLDREQVLQQIRRVLKPEGRFVCLTPNGSYLWYTGIAAHMGYAVRHLTSDQFITEGEFRALLAASGFTLVTAGYWSFIPRGDMPALAGTIMSTLDALGRVFGIPGFRGGLYIAATPSPDR